MGRGKVAKRRFPRAPLPTESRIYTWPVLRMIIWLVPDLYGLLLVSTCDRRYCFVLSRGHHLGQLHSRKGVCQVVESWFCAADVGESATICKSGRRQTERLFSAKLCSWPNSWRVFCESTSISRRKTMNLLSNQSGALIHRVLECGFG